MSQADDHLSDVLSQAAKRMGKPEEPRKRGRPRGPNYVPQERKKREPEIFAADEAATLRNLVIEKLKRRIDGLKLYQPMPIQERFHTSNVREKLLRGSNRSGKTVAASVEVARALTGADPRYPTENGIAYIVGKDGKEMANVMYKLLFRAGAFKIIRDLDTNAWRAFNPETDAARIQEAKLSPPLVPPRLVKSISWEKKAAGQPELIKLHNGWEIHCFSSNALPPHGTQIDLCWFDEEILNQSWYSEVAARLVDREGKFIWSATPQAGTAQLYELHERAEKELRLPADQRLIEEFVVTIADNIHLTDKQKREFESKLSEDDIRVRIYGEFAAHGLRVFPEFKTESLVCEFFEIPPEWTIYAAIDPGRQTCAVLFAAVPQKNDHIYAFDELYLHQCSADLFGQKMRDKCMGRNIEAMIIDHQEGRKAETGSGRTVEEQYSEALEKYGVACRRSGVEFTPGAADPKGGVEAVRAWLRSGPNSGPKLRILTDRCPNFIWEMKRYWYERDKDGRVTDKPRDRGPVHLAACARYLAQDNVVYVEPKQSKPRESAVWKFAQELMGKNKNNAINLGPGSFTIGVGAA